MSNTKRWKLCLGLVITFGLITIDFAHFPASIGLFLLLILLGIIAGVFGADVPDLPVVSLPALVVYFP